MKNLEAVLAHIRKQLSYADSKMSELWQLMMRRSLPIKDGDKSDSKEQMLQEHLANLLQPLNIDFAIALEMMGLTETRGDFLFRWSNYSQTDFKEPQEFHSDDGDFLESIPLNYCHKILRYLEMTFESEATSIKKSQIDTLEFVLKSTAKIVRDFSRTPPAGEMDIQRLMHPFLANTFLSFTKNLTISKPITSFKPDCGIIDLSAAIEFKFVKNVAELGTALRGLTEDLSGYSGSLDWTDFYSVIYQTGAFGHEDQVRDALLKSGNADRWRVFLVTGP